MNANSNTAYNISNPGHGSNGGGGGYYAAGTSNTGPWGSGGFPGGGSGNNGSGGGFAMKVCDVTPGTAIACTVGASTSIAAGAGLIIVEW